MKKISIFFIIMLICCSASAGTIGTNIGGVTDYTQDWPFLNVMKTARPWIVGDDIGDDNAEMPMNSNGYPLQIPFDPDDSGPEGDHVCRTLFMNNSETIYPTGTYSLRFSGTGEVWMRGDVTNCSADGENDSCHYTTADTWHTFDIVSRTGGGFQLKILSSNISDPIVDIQIILPTYRDEFEAGQIFHPWYLEKLNGFSYIRMMDWTRTNDVDDVEDWEDRTPEGRYTYANAVGATRSWMGAGGVPWEVCVSLCNELDQDIWVNIPHKATDAYVTSLAQLLEDSLETGRKIYVEYSNEVWNGIFDQEDYATAQGAAIFDTGEQAKNISYWIARRSGEIFDLFDAQISTHEIVKVVSGQGVVPYRLEKIVEGLNSETINPGGNKADALAIAYYVGAQATTYILTKTGWATSTIAGKLVDSDANFVTDGVQVDDIIYNVSDNSSYTAYATVTGVDSETQLSVDSDIFSTGERYARIKPADVTTDDVNAVSQADIFAWVRKDIADGSSRIIGIDDHKTLADQEGVKLISYEGGQSLYASGLGFTVSGVVTAMEDKLLAANRDSEMGDVYDELFAAWTTHGGQEFCNFSYINSPQSSGSWGILEYNGQDTETAYKYLAVMRAITGSRNKSLNLSGGSGAISFDGVKSIRLGD